MLRTCAIQLTNKVYKHCHLPEARKAVYIYGFEVFLSTASSILSILILSVALSVFPATLLFLFMFCSLRAFVGGYHAKTYGRCFFLTHFVYFVTIAASQLIVLIPSSILYNAICISLVLFSTFIMLIFAPIKNVNHPLSNSQYRKNQKIARILAPMEGLFSILLLIFPIDYSWGTLSAVTLMAVAVMMIIPKIQERRI